MFYAPWCHHCHELLPEYEKAEITLNQLGIYAIYKLDCDQARQFCESLHIPGFPMIKIFNYGKETETYEGQRKSEDLIEYIKSKFKQYTPQANLNQFSGPYSQNNMFPSQYYPPVFKPFIPPQQQIPILNPSFPFMNFQMDRQYNQQWNDYEEKNNPQTPIQTPSFSFNNPYSVYNPLISNWPSYPFPSIFVPRNLPTSNRIFGNRLTEPKLYPQSLPFITSPLPSFNQPAFAMPQYQSQNLPFYKNYLFENAFSRSLDFNAFKKNSFDKVDSNILWNPEYDLAHRPLIKQTIYPKNYLSRISPDLLEIIHPQIQETQRAYKESTIPQNYHIKTQETPNYALDYILNTFK
ncbi:hypothetical protein MXB_2922, partial [Myxobolus squamalis]